jgi:hypothetical protein
MSKKWWISFEENRCTSIYEDGSSEHVVSAWDEHEKEMIRG